MVVRIAINATNGDLAFKDAYPPIDGHTNYLRTTLCRSARFLNLSGYAKRFDQDHEFGKALGKVVCNHILVQDDH
jgi:hypothetical protein